MVTHVQMIDAKTVIEYAIKQGMITREEVNNLTDDEYIKLADSIDTYDRED